MLDEILNRVLRELSGRVLKGSYAPLKQPENLTKSKQ
jgi:hypothetical protein